MYKVVCDTNIYISAYNFGGTPKRILEHAIMQDLLLYISPSILAEIKRVLLDKFKWSDGSVQELLANIRNYAQLVEPRHSLNVVKRDSTDNRILECALAAKADYIITGDDDLLSLKTYTSIMILTSRQFLDGMRKAA